MNLSKKRKLQNDVMFQSPQKVHKTNTVLMNSPPVLNASFLHVSPSKQNASFANSPPGSFIRHTNTAPPKKGMVPIPVGAHNCLHACSFLITGVLTSLERQEATDLIKNYGGVVYKSVAKSLTHAVVGDVAGPKKLQQFASNPNIKVINEAELLDMIRSFPAGPDVLPPKNLAQLTHQSPNQSPNQRVC